MGSGHQPILTFAPDVSDQSFTVEEGTAFNFQIALDANSDIVNMYGESDAWTISMWVKPTSSTATQTLMVYGAGDGYNGGAITLKQQGGTSLVFNYGTVYNSIILVCGNSFTANTWQHVMVTFDGGTTGSVSANALVELLTYITITMKVQLTK